jgi:hypothetical protein
VKPGRAMSSAMYTLCMADVIFVAVALAFFVLCAGYVWWCDQIIGSDQEVQEAGTVER